MIPHPRCSATKKGFSLVESLVFLFIFMLISVVFLQVYVVGTRTILDVKNRLGATELANQKMEIIRSIEYGDIGTKIKIGNTWLYGVPAGDLLQEEDISVNTHKYHVSTVVQYVDDSLDGEVSGTPQDTIPTDYKRVRVEVSWGNAATERVVLFGNFSPPGTEVATTGGVLLINVLKADGTGLSGATVHVANTALGVNTNAVTNSAGQVILPGMPAAAQSYVVTVSKNGYFGATTYPPYPTSSYNPTNVHATVVLNKLNQLSIIMDSLVAIPIKTVDPFDQPLPGIHFNLTGGRVLGITPSTGAPVVTLTSINQVTDGSGEYTYTNQSYGEYTFALNTASTGVYELYKVLPETTQKNDTLDVAPGSTTSFKAVLLNTAIGSLKVAVQNQDTTVPIEGASVHLEDAAGYSATGTTDKFGWTYFPQNTTPLAAGNYTLTVSNSGYISQSSSIAIGGVLEKKTIQLKAN